MKNIIALLALALIAATPTPTPTPPPLSTGKFVTINLDYVTMIYPKQTPNVYTVEFEYWLTDVIGDPLQAPLVKMDYVKMELAPDNTP